MLETIEELAVPDIEKEKLVPGRESDINNLETDAPKKDEEKKEPLVAKKENEEKEETGEK